jgi:hypothetical protein
MFRTVGYVFLVLAIGSLAIAWSGRTVTHTPGHTGSIVPEAQYGGLPLPTQQMNDMTFVFSDEQ